MSNVIPFNRGHEAQFYMAFSKREGKVDPFVVGLRAHPDTNKEVLLGASLTPCQLEALIEQLSEMHAQYIREVVNV